MVVLGMDEDPPEQRVRSFLQDECEDQTCYEYNYHLLMPTLIFTVRRVCDDTVQNVVSTLVLQVFFFFSAIITSSIVKKVNWDYLIIVGFR